MIPCSLTIDAQMAFVQHAALSMGTDIRYPDGSNTKITILSLGLAVQLVKERLVPVDVDQSSGFGYQAREMFSQFFTESSCMRSDDCCVSVSGLSIIKRDVLLYGQSKLFLFAVRSRFEEASYVLRWYNMLFDVEVLRGHCWC